VGAVFPGGARRLLAPEETRFPPGERSTLDLSPTEVLWLEDGTLLIGASDGAVSAHGPAGPRRFTLGFRGAIRGLAPAGEGLFAVTTAAGVMALVAADGRLRWEREVTAEPLGRAVVTRDGTVLAASARGVFALSAAGEVVFSHGMLGFPAKVPPLTLEGDEVVAGKARFRLDAPHPAIPGLEPSFALSFQQVDGERYSALVAGGPGEVVALVDYAVDEHHDFPRKPTQSLTRVAGGRRTSTALPHQTAGQDAFQTKRLGASFQHTAVTKPETDVLVSDGLAQRPDGGLWILGRRLSGHLTGGEDGDTGSWVSAGVILEPGGNGARERRDLHDALTEHPAVGAEGMIAAAPHGLADLFCFGLADTVCALHEGPGPARLLPAPDRIVSVARVGDGDWLVTLQGRILRRAGETFSELPAPSAAVLTTVAGTGERDLWAAPAAGWAVTHWDGAAWRDVAVPAEPAGGLFVRAADDAWLRNGKARWDGGRWSLLYGAPPARAVLARGRDDVWLAGEGLWHATAPGPTPVRLPAPPDAVALAAPAAAPLGPVDAEFVAVRRPLPVAGAEPLITARRVTAGAGVLWFSAWDRLVELDASGAARTVRPDGWGFARTALPEAPGRGLFVERGEVRRFAGPKGSDVLGTLDQRTLVALDGDASGALWAVGVSEAESRWPTALLRAGAGGSFQPVLGLPAATWVDVAAAPDGGAWFAGGLSPGPTGEGILFHARGAAGRGGSARYRAGASLLAVAAVGPDEAWAVGAAGVVVHVQGAAVTRWALPSGEWLRTVAVAGPREVWLGGDGGTLLRFDGEVFHAVPHPLGGNAAVTSIAVLGGVVWAVGPSGIVRVARRG
jgi:hypothetical protein